MGRAPCCDKNGLKKGPWTPEEDQKLIDYIQKHGHGSWRTLPKNAGLARCGKSCRLRWINYLRGDLKRGDITKEEEELIIQLHSTLGNRWSLIAGHLPGRTDNEIKNYWNSHLSRRIHSFRKIGSENEIVMMVLDKVPGGGKRRGGRTSRSAMKKNNSGATSSQNSSEGSNSSTVPDPPQQPDPGLDPAQKFMSPVSQVVDSEVWDQDGLMSPGEGGALAFSEFCGPLSPADQVEKLLDWEMIEMGPKLWAEEGEMWSWLCDEGDTGEFEAQQGLEQWASWLFSDV